MFGGSVIRRGCVVSSAVAGSWFTSGCVICGRFSKTEFRHHRCSKESTCAIRRATNHEPNFLRRHDLLLDGEAERLSDADFDSLEVVVIEEADELEIA